jgi:hypothetical protein
MNILRNLLWKRHQISILFESQQFIECFDYGDYLQKDERRINEEIERVSHYLDSSNPQEIFSCKYT